MEDPSLAYEDMLFFERRLTEVISSMEPKAKKWRIALVASFLITAYGAYFWIVDPSIRNVTLRESLMNHPLFTISFAILIILFLVCGVHKRVVAPKITALRCRTVLADFCLSCDESGKLIVRPAPAGSVPVRPPAHMLDSSFARRTDSRIPQKNSWQMSSLTSNMTRSSLLRSDSSSGGAKNSPQMASPITQVSSADEDEYLKQRYLLENQTVQDADKSVFLRSSNFSKRKEGLGVVDTMLLYENGNNEDTLKLLV